MASVDENKEYLTKHLSYEITMLRYAIDLLVGCQPGLRGSMYFECFAIHARACRAFLMNEDGNNCKAKDYNKDFKASSTSNDDKEALKLITRLDTRVFHLAKSERDRDRITVGQAVKMYNWIVKELERFGRELSQEAYRAAWSASVSVGGPVMTVVDAGAYATNHFSNTASYAPGDALRVRTEVRLGDDGESFILYDTGKISTAECD